jgi:hypothetical protein
VPFAKAGKSVIIRTGPFSPFFPLFKTINTLAQQFFERRSVIRHLMLPEGGEIPLAGAKLPAEETCLDSTGPPMEVLILSSFFSRIHRQPI